MVSWYPTYARQSATIRDRRIIDGTAGIGRKLQLPNLEVELKTIVAAADVVLVVVARIAIVTDAVVDAIVVAIGSGRREGRSGDHPARAKGVRPEDERRIREMTHIVVQEAHRAVAPAPQAAAMRRTPRAAHAASEGGAKRRGWPWHVMCTLRRART